MGQNARDLLLRRHLRPHLDHPPHLGRPVTAAGPPLVAARMTVRSVSSSAVVHLVTVAGPQLAAGGMMVRLASTRAAATRWLTAPKSRYEIIRMQNQQMSSDLSRVIIDQRGFKRLSESSLIF